MNVRVYTVFDRAAKSFGNLMFFANDDMCRRGCTDLFRAGGAAPMLLYPADFDVYCVGEFDTDIGALAGFEQPVMVVRFSDVAASLNAQLAHDGSRVGVGDGMPASAFPDVDL